MVILIGQLSNHTMKLMKKSTDSNYITEHTEELKLKDNSLSFSCYNRVVAFDIEYDGSVGILPVPGYLMSTAGHLEKADGPCIGSRSSITVGTSGMLLIVWCNNIITMLCVSALDSDDFRAFMLCVYMVQLLYRIRKYDFSVCCNEGHDHCIHRLFSV